MLPDIQATGGLLAQVLYRAWGRQLETVLQDRDDL